MSYNYKNIITAYSPHVKFHDDMTAGDESEGNYPDVVILSFPFDSLFNDYRIFNGIPMHEVDFIIGKLRTIMIDLKNRHCEIGREERLRLDKLEREGMVEKR